jgi:hypothetical protein
MPGEFYVVACDTSWGGSDYSAAQFLCKTKIDVPVVYHSREMASEMTPLIHHELERIYDETRVKPVVAYERNNGGIAELERLSALNRHQKYKIYQMKIHVGSTEHTENTVKLGFETNTATRPTMLSMLKDAVDKRVLTLYDKPTINEMFSFIIKQGNTGSWKATAESGAHDDLIMSLAIAWQLYQTEKAPVDPNTVHFPDEELFQDGFYL